MKISHRRGLTLIELLVTIAGLVVVMGLALGIAGESEATTRNIARQQNALQYGQTAIAQIADTLRSAVDPSNFTNPAFAAQMRFSADTLRIATYASDGDPALRLVTLRNKPGSNGQPASLERHVEVIDPQTGQVNQQRQEPLVRVEARDFEPHLRFAYAGVVEPGQAVTWADTWSSPSLPRLIRISVDSALQGQETTRTVHLQTAVMPGVLGGIQ